MHDLQSWETFYVIVGGAAGALIGVQFVVMTLIAIRPTTRKGVGAFATPTVVHFVTTLILSALASAPWRDLEQLAIAWGVIGIAGVVYGLAVGWRMRRQDVHEPTLSDWLLHFVLPLGVYAILIFASTAARESTDVAIWLAAAAALLLLVLGVRSAWGVVSYHATGAEAGT